jgi:hypothetical protein
MQDVIGKIIATYARQGRKLEVLRRYIRIKYRIHLDSEALQNRIKSYEDSFLPA